MEQYFSNKPGSKDIDKSFQYIFEGQKFLFSSNNGVFSKNGVDFGTDLLLKSFREDNITNSMENMSIGDAGCGIGIVGVVLGKLYPQSNIVMFDINERAVGLARENAENNRVYNTKITISDVFDNVDEKSFDYILTNPPIRAGKKVVFSFYEKAYERLKENGAIYVVIQNKQGADSSQNKLKELFGNSTIIEKKAGFKILKSIKGSV